MKDVLKNIIKTQDSDGHWYWIPEKLSTDFINGVEKISGIEYMDDPDAFDLFSGKYEQYRTLGDPNNIPHFFKDI